MQIYDKISYLCFRESKKFVSCLCYVAENCEICMAYVNKHIM